MNYALEIPWGYGREKRTLAAAEKTLLAHYHPEYVRRLIAWLDSKEGLIGIGGHFRADGTQPNKPGFAPEGKSFHQNQRYADGFIGACAVDLVRYNRFGGVHLGVRYQDVPMQGTVEAKRWGVHCNIANEPWHMQPVEIDGWQSWVNAGSAAPTPNYPLPTPSTSPYAQWPEMPKHAISEGHRGELVKYAQYVMTTYAGQGLVVDGIFGPKTTGATKNLQRFFNLTVDGIIGTRETWPVIDFLYRWNQ